jgi:hypothetical protein
LLESKQRKKTHSTTRSACGTIWLDILIRKRSGGNQLNKEEREKVLWYRGVSVSHTIVSHAEIIWKLPSMISN